jgi:ParB family chromosome partitioning protein
MELLLTQIVESDLAMRFVAKTLLEYTQLRDSMHERRLPVPITVRLRKDGKYEIIDGIQRYAAAKELEWETITAEVVEATDDEAMIMALKLNGISVPPAPLEYAHQLRKLLSRNPEWTVGYLAGTIGQPRDWVLKQLDLMKLHPQVQADVDAGRITVRNAYLLSRAPQTWHLEFREAAAVLSYEEFAAKLLPPLKAWRYRVTLGRQKEDAPFEPIASVRSMKILRSALDKPSVADMLVVENKCVTFADAFRLGVAWALNLDPASQQAQRVAAQRKLESLQRQEDRRIRRRRREAGNPKTLDQLSISKSSFKEPKE